MTKTMNRPAPASKLGNSHKRQLYDNSATTQRARILKHFQSCPRLTVMESRDVFGILHPSGRVRELRNQGHLIVTHSVPRPDANGVYHRIGMFIYCGLGDFTNISWEKVVRLLPTDSGYDNMNLDQRYNMLKKFILEKHLSVSEYDAAVKSLCDFLEY